MRIRIHLCIFLVLFYEIVNVPLLRSKYEAHSFTSCFEDLGCIETTGKWYHEKYRPKNLEPLDRHTIRTEFLLMKDNQNSSTELLYDVMSMKKESIAVAGFKGGTCSIFIIHDFTANGYTGWIKHLVIALTHRTDCNIISVDWEAGAEPPFEQAIANARVVALEAKIFISQLMCSFQQCVESLHIIGHGVGAHIAGYIGKYIKGVQRITGLDPTGPRFEHMPAEVRLDYHDAKYVEILHTDAHAHKSQGTRQPYGHVDFYLNDAEHQPGCNDSSHTHYFLTLDRDSLQEGHILPACSHKRAFKYYIEAVEDDQCQFIGVKCDTYKNFLMGKCDCSNKCNCASFGLEKPALTTHNNTFYLVTNAKKPFCLITYIVNVTVAKEAQKKESEGYFEMILVDVDDKVTNASSNPHGTNVRVFESGHTYKFLFYAPTPPMGRIKEARVKWVYKSKKICITCTKSLVLHDIGIQKLMIRDEGETPIISWICPLKRDTILKSGDFAEFLNCEDMYGPEYLKNHVALNASASHVNKSPAMMELGTAMETSEPTSTEMCADVANDSQASSEMAPARRSNQGCETESDATTIQSFKECFDDPTITTTTDKNSCENMDEEKMKRHQSKSVSRAAGGRTSARMKAQQRHLLLKHFIGQKGENANSEDAEFVADYCDV